MKLKSMFRVGRNMTYIFAAELESELSGLLDQ